MVVCSFSHSGTIPRGGSCSGPTPTPTRRPGRCPPATTAGKNVQRPSLARVRDLFRLCEGLCSGTVSFWHWFFSFPPWPQSAQAVFDVAPLRNQQPAAGDAVCVRHRHRDFHTTTESVLRLTIESAHRCSSPSLCARCSWLLFSRAGFCSLPVLSLPRDSFARSRLPIPRLCRCFTFLSLCMHFIICSWLTGRPAYAGVIPRGFSWHQSR